MKELVGTFNQEKVLVGNFSVIVKTDGSFAALLQIQGGQNLGREGTKPGYIMRRVSAARRRYCPLSLTIVKHKNLIKYKKSHWWTF